MQHSGAINSIQCLGLENCKEAETTGSVVVTPRAMVCSFHLKAILSVLSNDQF